MDKYIKVIEKNFKFVENKVDKILDLNTNQVLSMARAFEQLFDILNKIWLSETTKIRIGKFEWLIKYLDSRKNFVLDSQKKQNYINIIEEFKNYEYELCKQFILEDKYHLLNHQILIENENFREFLDEYYKSLYC